ncbi:hypothetical protein EC988_000381 [Linderina pennispora]|nr:hypothetical protein EC988_000381 [Linderina pennispora]
MLDNTVKHSSERFVAQENSVESKLKLSTVGLVKLEEFQRIKGALEEERQRKAANTLVDSEAARPKKQKKKKIAKLSFGDDSEEEEEVRKKVVKNPAVDTSFLPDAERDAADAQAREQLRQKWLLEQEKIKDEPVLITYSYWDGTGHRFQVSCRKGDTIRQFLDKCRGQVKELQHTSADALVYVKEDLIIPHRYTFYDFIVNKARGKSGPLFNFDVHEDVRLASDARVERGDSHAGKVCERAWYERNKHIFPANRWEMYDPERDYGTYTVKDTRRR